MDLLDALIDASAGHGTDGDRVLLAIAARILADLPEVAGAWGRVLTEHSASQPVELSDWLGIQPHAFAPSLLPPHGECAGARWPGDGFGCGEPEDARVHRAWLEAHPREGGEPS